MDAEPLALMPTLDVLVVSASFDDSSFCVSQH
jgi:hypothetical protein